jgi:hypothetical protein
MIDDKIWETLSNAIEQLSNSKYSCKTIEDKSILSLNSKNTLKSKYSSKSMQSCRLLKSIRLIKNKLWKL